MRCVERHDLGRFAGRLLAARPCCGTATSASEYNDDGTPAASASACYASRVRLVPDTAHFGADHDQTAEDEAGCPYTACSGGSCRDFDRTAIAVLCLDNDKAGHAASERMAELLRERDVMTERLVPEMKDWNDDLLHGQKEDLAPCLSL